MKALISFFFKLADLLLAPLTLVSAAWMKVITTIGIQRSLLAEKIFMAFGVLPVRDHYYQPLVNPRKHLRHSLREDRNLPGLDLNTPFQLELIDRFNYNAELQAFPLDEKGLDESGFFYNNTFFESGDAEFLYNIIRLYKPRKMVEIGSGASTLIAIEAFRKNEKEDAGYAFEHLCIEPYEQQWLEKTPAKIIRKKVEETDLEMFSSLEANDILFIDSSHIIRPQGDVLHEFLVILPVLKPGVLVHIHDIFTPRDYPDDWIFNKHLLWNEQYLVEALLSGNSNYEVIGALNYLRHHHRDKLAAKCPVFSAQAHREPGSFWIRKK